MWVAFAYTCELDIVLTRTVNIFTTNELIELKMLWTTGPWALSKRGIQISFSYFSMKTKNMQKVEARSDNTSLQSDQGFQSLPTESLDTVEYISVSKWVCGLVG